MHARRGCGWALSMLFGVLLTGGAAAQIVSGRFLDWDALHPDVRPFGDGTHHVTAAWSIGQFHPSTGWFYGGPYAQSDSAVALAPGCDVSTISDASALSFVNSGAIGHYPERSLIVWRHLFTGFYGVLRVDRMRAVGWLGHLDGTWYFQSDGGGNFSGALRRGDFDRNQHTDLLLRQHASGRLMTWLLNGTTQTGAPQWVSPDPGAAQRVVGVDDFDGDNDSDLVLQDQASGVVEFWRLEGSARVGAALPLTGGPPRSAAWQVAASGDFDGDGQGDLVWRNLITQKLEVWALDGTTYRSTLMPSPDQALDANWAIVAAQDYDGDGNRDLLWYNRDSGKLVQWLLNPSLQRTTGRFVSPSSAGNLNWRLEASADFGVGPNGVACTADVVWRNASSGRLVVWYLDLDGNRTAGTFTTPDGPLADPDGLPTIPADWSVSGPR